MTIIKSTNYQEQYKIVSLTPDSPYSDEIRCINIATKKSTFFHKCSKKYHQKVSNGKYYK